MYQFSFASPTLKSQLGVYLHHQHKYVGWHKKNFTNHMMILVKLTVKLIGLSIFYVRNKELGNVIVPLSQNRTTKSLMMNCLRG